MKTNTINRTARRVVPTFLIALICLYGTSCATVSPGNDAVLVDAQKTNKIAYSAITTFLNLEYQNKVLVKANAPEVHQFAERLRQRNDKGVSFVRQSLQSLWDATETYRLNRTDQNKADLNTALAVVKQLMQDAQNYTAKVQSKPAGG
jgi:hypothetical protein